MVSSRFLLKVRNVHFFIEVDVYLFASEYFGFFFDGKVFRHIKNTIVVKIAIVFLVSTGIKSSLVITQCFPVLTDFFGFLLLVLIGSHGLITTFPPKVAQPRVKARAQLDASRMVLDVFSSDSSVSYYVELYQPFGQSLLLNQYH